MPHVAASSFLVGEITDGVSLITPMILPKSYALRSAVSVACREGSVKSGSFGQPHESHPPHAPREKTARGAPCESAAGQPERERFSALQTEQQVHKRRDIADIHDEI